MKSKITSTFGMIFVVCTSVFLMSQRAIAQIQGSTSETPCECWIDVKTGKRVPSVPASGINYGRTVTNLDNGGQWSDPGVAVISEDGNSARNTKTGQNYAKEPDAWPTEKKASKKKQDVSAIGLSYD